MKLIFTVMLSFSMLFGTGQTFGSNNMSNTEVEALTPQEGAMLAYMWEMEKYLRDTYLTGSGCSDSPDVSTAATTQQENMDTLKELLIYFGLEVPLPTETVGSFSKSFLETLARGEFTWSGWDWACVNPPASIYFNAMLYEDFAIWNLLQAIEETNNKRLFNAYNFLLADACEHLQLFASLHPAGWEGMFLSESLVSEILAGEFPPPFSTEFILNPGINDAWYEPATDGQGFFISVFPNKGTVFVGWFTFDMDFPDQNAIAGLGDTCQRWLTAHGPYDGDQANLVVYNSSGGLFDSEQAVPQVEPVGSITLQFENCESGTVIYDLASYGLMGEIPIQRVASDNIAACEAQAYLSR